MASRSSVPYHSRAETHPNLLVKSLFELAVRKKSNLVVSADLTTSKALLDCAEKLGPYIAVFKTHIDIVSDFSDETVEGLKRLSAEHDFLIFEDRKLIDIGNTVQKQYHGGSLRISEWAHLVNLSVLGGEGIVEALSQTISDPNFPYPKGERGFLILAEMTSKGSAAKGDYTTKCIEAARLFPEAMVGFVATRALDKVHSESKPAKNEDFVVFTTGVNISSKGDKLGQQYQTPKQAVQGGADFIIAGRGIYAAADPIEAAKEYRQAGWEAYLERTSSR